MRGSWRPNRTATYGTPTLMSISVSFPFSWAAQPWAWGPASRTHCWFSLPHLVSNSSDPQLLNRGLEGSVGWMLAFSTASYLQLVWSPKPSNFLSSTSYIIVQRPPSSCGRHNFALIQLVHGQVYNPDIPRPNEPVIYTGAFPILTARQVRKSIYNTLKQRVRKQNVEYFFKRFFFNSD